MASLVLNNIFEEDGIKKIGVTLVKVAACAPRCLVTQTPFMKCFFKCLLRCGSKAGSVAQKDEMNKHVATTLQFEESQYNVPSVSWAERCGHRFPLILATPEQIGDYYKERRVCQILWQMPNQVDHLFRKKALEATKLPRGALTWWLRGALLNSSCTWYVIRGPKGGYWEIDLSTIVDEVEHESADCKYNVRDLRLHDDGRLIVNHATSHPSARKIEVRDSSGASDGAAPPPGGDAPVGDSSPLLGAPGGAPADAPLEHAVFLSLTFLQQCVQATFHNWIHFYFNDLTLLAVQTQFPKGHWVRQLLDPHMRYQAVLNNAGMFSHLPNDPKSNEIYDDVLFLGNLTSWTLDTFNMNIADKALGYYKKADYSRACSETNRLEFDLSKSPGAAGGLCDLITKVDESITRFVGQVIDGCMTEADEQLMALVTGNVTKYLHEGCYKGIKRGDDNIKGRFKLLVSRYILYAGFLHGLEHFNMYFWFAPLRLPQRIRKFFDPSLALEDYSIGIDKMNGYYGHEMFTRYRPNEDGKWNWASLEYEFANPDVRAISLEFVKSVQRHLAEYDEKHLAPARKVMDIHSIPYPKDCVLTGSRIGCSICM